MKTIIVRLLIILIAGTTAKSQTLNKEITKEGGTPFLLGEINKSALEQEHYASWFSKNYENYSLDSTTIEALKSPLQDYYITVFMGTWCGDSKQEIPKFYKVLDACNFPKNQLRVIAVNRKDSMYKKSPNHEESGLNIHRVPTFIFYNNKQEMNRIVEHPIESFEKDMLNIVTKNTYKSNYQIVSNIHNILKKEGLNGLKRERKSIANYFDGTVKNIYELQTYSRILCSINQKQEAIVVLELNTKLFPKNPKTYLNLAHTLDDTGGHTKAATILEKALLLFPENSELKASLETIKQNK